MIFKNEKQILKIIRYTPPIFIMFISLLLLAILFIEKNSTFNKEKIKIENDFLLKNQQLIKQKVYETHNFIEKEKALTETELKETLKLAINNAHAIATTIYNQNKDKDPELIKKIIIDALRNIRFNNGRGYYFVYDKTGTNKLLPFHEKLEGKNLWNHKDSKGTYIVQEMIKGLKTSDNLFYEWYWFNPIKPEKQKRKIGLVKNFEPYDWFIGTGEYIEDFEKEVQKKILRHINDISYGENSYMFIINYDTVYLSHIKKNYIGKTAVENNDTKEIKKVINDLIRISKDGEGFYKYVQQEKPTNEKNINKTSFVKGFNEWSWMIGTGFYEDDMQKALNIKKEELNIKFEENINRIIKISILLIFLLLLASIYFSDILSKKFEKYKKEINLHIKNNTEQQNILAQQSKMASMGEMIGNIAHQWRQPLSVISTTSTGLKLQKEMNILDDTFLINGLENINQQSQYLSSTIDDFRNFFTINKQKNEFNIKESIKKAISLISAKFKNKNIFILDNLIDIKISSYENEFIQVIINILNNACDELIKKDNLEKKVIFISIKKDNNQTIIEIKDNAGGIKENIIDKIFEPYFTTKHQKQGTGIGLYMSREIIMKNMKGNITAINDKFTHNNIEYQGALFRITLPL